MEQTLEKKVEKDIHLITPDICGVAVGAIFGYCDAKNIPLPKIGLNMHEHRFAEIALLASPAAANFLCAAQFNTKTKGHSGAAIYGLKEAARTGVLTAVSYGIGYFIGKHI